MRPVSRVHAAPFFTQPKASQPSRSLEFLQHKDVFFSGDSVRAKVMSLFAQKAPQPLMFTFVNHDHAPIWDKVLPPSQRDVLLLKPQMDQARDPHGVSGASDDKPKEAQKQGFVSKPRVSKGTVSQTSNPFESALNEAMAPQRVVSPDALEKQPSAKKAKRFATPVSNPFSGKTRLYTSSWPVFGRSLTSKNSAPLKESAPRLTQVDLHHLTGQMIKPQFFHQLDMAYATAGWERATPRWVHQAGDVLRVLSQENPQQAGFVPMEHPLQGLAIRGFARFVAPILGLRVDQDALSLPNGARLSLHPRSWLDASGRRANLYQTVGLPNGTWLRLNQAPEVQTVPVHDAKRLASLVETKVQRLEQTGKSRELV